MCLPCICICNTYSTIWTNSFAGIKHILLKSSKTLLICASRVHDKQTNFNYRLSIHLFYHTFVPTSHLFINTFPIKHGPGFVATNAKWQRSNAKIHSLAFHLHNNGSHSCFIRGLCKIPGPVSKTTSSYSNICF